MLWFSCNHILRARWPQRGWECQAHAVKSFIPVMLLAPCPCSKSLHMGAGSRCQLFHPYLPAELCLRSWLGEEGRGAVGRGGEWCCWDGALVVHLPPCSVRQAWPQAEGGGSLHPSTCSWLTSLSSSSWAHPAAAPVCQGREPLVPLTPPGCHHPAWPWMHWEKRSEHCW